MSIYNILLLVVARSMLCSAEGNLCDLPNVENGKIAQYLYIFKKIYFPMEVNKKLSVSCSAGYTFKSGRQEGEITCTSEGWEPPTICFKKCIKPSLVNGFLLNAKESYKTLEMTQYSCLEGYTTTTGDTIEQIQCSSGEWSPPPGCHNRSDRCEVPPLDNGYYMITKTHFRIKENVQYQCNEGYYTARGSTAEWVECLHRGWSSLPGCTKSTCGKLEPVENGGFYPIKASYMDMDVVQFFCKENYSLKGSELIQCYSFGWDPEQPTCEERRNKCPPPPRVAHSILLMNASQHRIGDTVHYECDDNYKLIGSEQIHCENGHWTTPPSCVELKEKIKCDNPPQVDNGETVMTLEVYQSGDTVHYRCAEGYEIQGSNKIICKKGKWTETPKCSALSVSVEHCGTPPVISHAELIDAPLPRYISGSSVNYRCHSYHLMEGSQTVHCIRGMWSDQPKCLQPCTLITAQMKENNLEHSYDTNSTFLHGDMMEFKCMDGFDMLADSELKGLCQNGQILYPTCRKKDTVKICGNPPVVKHSVLTDSQQTYVPGSFVVYQCPEHHYLNGHSTIHCVNGQWESPPTCIEPCVLSKEEMDRSQVRLKWSLDSEYFLHGEFLDFLCKPGYENREFTAKFSLRSQCRNGQLSYPKCMQRNR
ncbi:coagulation factor XIII B chain-like [Pseudophryne corroboree]|uniref:coagulation factor XIII B chain-like n=1 Tax=Pseudophryne corroboree TaxID=495146 RepID=UPI003081326D